MPTPLKMFALLAILSCTLLAAPANAADEGKAKLPLAKVVLFNSGVGFFEHAAEIEGDARVDLKFNVDDINDLLKSMVLQDLGGGRISTVNYGSKDPITKTLKTFAIDLTTNPTLADLLGQIRGEKVSLDAPNAITGTIVGVETRPQPVGRDGQVVDAHFLNLLTDDGLRSVPLATVGRIKLVNESLDAELRQALAILALGHATDKKTVSLNFLGRGKRPVRVGYVQEAPIWKTSYRLVLNDDEAPFLQGWAIVENTTEEDWQGVGLTLVSGRPISFVMDLYQPLYVQRPVVEPELFASLRPQTYGQDLAAADKEFLGKAEKQLAGGLGGGQPTAAAAPPANAAAKAGVAFGANRGRGAIEEQRRLDLRQGAQSVAQADDVGELFQYIIDSPVTLPRQQSAMLPIVNASVEGKKVSIYNAQVHAKHPLNGLKFTNSTDLHLMQGPITVFDGGAYAGDAQIQDLPPGTERLISYALDLDTEVASESKGGSDQLVSVKLVKGVMHTTNKYERTQLLTVKNSGKRAKTVLIEHPYNSSWKLLAPAKPEEKTRDRYRFAVNADPGKPAKLEIKEERIDGEQIALTNMNDSMILYYINAKVVSDNVKKALGEVIARKQKLAELTAEKKRLEQQVQVIDQEQNRIRQNMAQLDRNTELYQRYVKKFGEQEDDVERLRGEIRRTEIDETKARQSLDSYLISLTLE